MNLKVLMIILAYYAILSVIILFPNSPMGAYDVANVYNDSDLNSAEVDTGGVFSGGVDFGRFFGLVTIGVGLPDDTPEWFAWSFAIWQSMALIFSVGFIISSIWDG